MTLQETAQRRRSDTQGFARGATPLLRWTKNSPPFLTKFACENIVTLAATGSCKTSAIDGALAISMLSHDFGMLKSCVKSDAYGVDLTGWARISHKEHMLRRVYEGGPLVFNGLAWAMECGGPTFAAQMLRELREGLSRGRFAGSSGDNAFFEDKSEMGNSGALDICHKATGTIDPDFCVKLWNTIPQTPSREDVEKSFCGQMCQRALDNCPEKDLAKLRRSVNFFIEEMAGLDLRPRSSVVVTATIPFQALTRPPLCDLFLGESTITPAALDDGAIIGIDVDGRHGAAANAAFIIWKFAAQHHILNRKTPGVAEDDLRPICLFLAEGDKVLSSHDARFSSLCRSARGCYYMSCQSVNSLFSEIGADPTGRSKVLSLLGNCNTHIYGCSCDKETLDFASDSMGQELVIRPGANAKMVWEPFFGDVPVGDGTLNLHPVWEAVVRRESIQALQRGADSYAGAFVRTLGPRGIEKYGCLFSQNLSNHRRNWWSSMTAPDSVQIL
jgi:hypothetical protein